MEREADPEEDRNSTAERKRETDTPGEIHKGERRIRKTDSDAVPAQPPAGWLGARLHSGRRSCSALSAPRAAAQGRGRARDERA